MQLSFANAHILIHFGLAYTIKQSENTTIFMENAYIRKRPQMQGLLKTYLLSTRKSVDRDFFLSLQQFPWFQTKRIVNRG